MSIHQPMGPSAASHHETAANYARVLLVKGRWRVAVCRDDQQWLFQQRVTTEDCAGARWRNKGFCLTRDSLITLQHRFLGEAWPALETLPVRFVSGTFK
ncbi:MAG: hypothetical protein ACI82I_000634 [Gammaproteobacteria bacterium]|jgi:hypothetical protein